MALNRLLLAALTLLGLTLTPAWAADWEWTTVTEPLPAGLSGSAVLSQPVEVGNPLLTTICE